MKMETFKNLLNSKNRYVSLNYSSSKTLSKLNGIVMKSLGRKINLQNKKDLKTLTLSEIKKIDNNIRNKYQKNLIKILKPEIKKITKGILDDVDLHGFHVGAQCKFKKKNVAKKNKKNKETFSTKMTTVNKALGEEFYNYPTVPHQDLYSVGFRSSSTFIFYFQLTPNYRDSCLMQISQFKNKVGIYDVTKKYILNNLNYVAKNKTVRNLNWKVPKDIRPGKIFLMDSITMHKSNEISQIPRIALNIKIIPKSLNYIYKIYKIKKRFIKSDNFYNLNILKNDLEKVSSYNNAINFELSILNLLKNNLDEAMIRLKKASLFNLNKLKANKIFTGGLFKIAMEDLNSHHISKFNRKKYKATKYSCAHSILNTFKGSQL